jgi:hypothetical protein
MAKGGCCMTKKKPLCPVEGFTYAPGFEIMGLRKYTTTETEMSKRKLSTHAAAAKMIRAELKKHGIKASVRSSTYSGGTSIRVSLKNEAPWTVKAIEDFCAKFEYGHFDGMFDIYEYSNVRDDVPQVKYLFVENEFDDEMREKAYRFLRGYMGAYENHPEHYKDAADLRGSSDWVSTEVWRVLTGHFDSTSIGTTKFWKKPRVKCAA